MSDLDFYQWQTPNEMSRLTEAFAEKHGWNCLKRVGRDFREAYVATRFAQHRLARSVRLLRANGTEPTPDFALRFGDEERWYETVEIDRPGRQRGAEAPIETARLIPAEEWITSSTYFVEASLRIQAKSQKPYRKCEGLVVWSNAFAISDAENITLDFWRRASASTSKSFNECWVYHRSEWLQMPRVLDHR